jgi:DNA-binding MarR family transcriptional regulator
MHSPADFGFLLKDLSRLYSRNFERHADALGLTLGDCRMLTYLSRAPGISQARLAWLTETDPMTLGRSLKRLEADGLIARTADAQDRRALTLALRPRANRLLGTILRLSERAREEALAGIGAADRARLMQLMDVMHGNLAALLPGLAERDPRTRRKTGKRPC